MAGFGTTLRLHLAQAYSNKAPKGRKNDFGDAKRLTRRLVAGELILSFVPDAEQRAWRTMTRISTIGARPGAFAESTGSLLEETRIKLSSVISDLLGASGRRILEALAGGETDPVKLAEWGDDRLKCSREELIDALRGRPEPMHVEILKLYLERLKLLDRQIESLDRMAAQALKKHEEAVIRLAQVPGLGVDSAQQIIAEVGVDVKAFPSAAQFASWAGAIPGSEESAEKNHSSRSPEGQQVPAADSEPGSAGSGQKKELPLPERVPQAACPAWDTKAHSGPSPTGSAAWSGRFCTTRSATSNRVGKQSRRPRNAAPKDSLGPCAIWAITWLSPR